MTESEIRAYTGMLTDQAISSASKEEVDRLKVVYGKINSGFDAYVDAFPEISALSMSDIRQHWTGFCSGFVLGQKNPEVGEDA